MKLEFMLIIAGVGVILAVLLFWYRKALRLFIIRNVYGRYSFKYFQLYKRYYIRSPYQYCFRDEFVAHLLFVMEKHQNLPTFKSVKNIYFENTPYFISYKEFLKKNGPPRCFNAFSFHNPDFVITALGYQDVIAGSKARIVFYFMNNRFFLGEYIFKNPRTNIKDKLIKHFLDDETVEANNFYIENTRKRTLHFQDTGFTVDVKYLTHEDSSITEIMRVYLNQINANKILAEKQENAVADWRFT